MRKRISDFRGFTLVELVVVLLVLAILSVAVVQRIGNVTSMKAGAFVRKLGADIRYAQNLAMTRNRRARVYFNGTGTAPAAGYAVVVDGAAGLCNAFAPAESPDRSGNLTLTLGAGDYAGLTVTPSTACLEYDSLGTPYDCSVNLANCASPEAGMTITAPAAPAAVDTVTVAAGTGSVTVN